MYDESQLKKRIDASLCIINEFRWLSDAYITDFFVDRHWNRLPDSWAVALQHINLPELGSFILGKPPPDKIVLPLSLLALVSAVRHLSLPRFAESENARSTSIGSTLKSHRSLHDKDITVNNLLTKRMKKKKRHEISSFARLIHEIAQETECKSIVDVGSGLGHLVRVLSFKYSIRSVGIEAQADLAKGAREIDRQLKYTLSKYAKSSNAVAEQNAHLPEHVNMHLSPAMNYEDFKTALSMLDAPIDKPIGIVGLHTCGDLGPSLLRMFREQTDAKFVCIVGCCYMKLSCSNDCCSYPLSKFTSSLNDNSLSIESRELACHAIETYCDRLRKNLYEDLQIHCFRAALEKILTAKSPNLKHIGLRSVKHYNTLSFQEYCKLALEKLDINIEESTIFSEEIEQCLKRWKQVVIFYTLRLILAPLVETIILCDRLLYIMEYGMEGEIIPLFDPLISPRNHVMIARRQ